MISGFNHIEIDVSTNDMNNNEFVIRDMNTIKKLNNIRLNNKILYAGIKFDTPIEEFVSSYCLFDKHIMSSGGKDIIIYTSFSRYSLSFVLVNSDDEWILGVYIFN